MGTHKAMKTVLVHLHSSAHSKWSNRLSLVSPFGLRDRYVTVRGKRKLKRLDWEFCSRVREEGFP